MNHKAKLLCFIAEGYKGNKINDNCQSVEHKRVTKGVIEVLKPFYLLSCDKLVTFLWVWFTAP